MNELIVAAFLSLLSLLIADWLKKETLAGWLKLLTSSLMVVFCGTLLLQQPNEYAYLIFAAISFGFLGDLLLIPKSKNSFLLGMLAFLIGHVIYIIAFSRFEINLFEWLIVFLSLSIVMFAVFSWVKKSLQGILKVGVIVYMAVLAVMCATALVVRIDGSLTLMAFGAILFTVSDFFVASHRFKKPYFINRLIGLPMYYCGQFILAFTIIAKKADIVWLPA